MDNFTQRNLLVDFYGQLLSHRQKQVMELYYEENLSLSEIGQEFNISRQGVHDALKNAEKSLENYEKKLGLVERFQRNVSHIEVLDQMVLEVLDLCDNHKGKKKLLEMKDIIDKMER